MLDVRVSPSFARFTPAAVLGATFVAMLSESWGKWPDVLVDFGRELYVPWQLSTGKVLGRDLLLWPTGSLPPYFNALAFKVFGVSLLTLVLVNLFLLAGLTWLLYVLLRRLGGWRSATASCAFFLVVFAFGQLFIFIGNYNYVTPYSHGATHGMLLSLISLAFAWRQARTGAVRDLALASLALGLVLLTKPEFFVACGGALAVMGAIRLRDAPDSRTRVRWALGLTVPALLPALISVSLLTLRAGLAAALQATFAPWWAMGTPLARNPFYARVLGLDDPLRNATHAGLWLGAYVVFFGAAAMLDLRVRTPRGRKLASTLAPIAIAISAWTIVPKWVWLEVAVPLPAIAAAACLASVAAAWRAPRPLQPDALLRAGLTTFAALLLAKMVLNATFSHYGFVLAMPAALLLVSWLLADAPRELQRRGSSGRVFVAIAATVIVIAAAAHLWVSHRVYAKKTEAVGSGADTFLTDGRGLYVNAMVSALRAAEPGTLAVLPEGVMINFLTRRESPSPHLVYMPDAIALWGERALLAPLQASPPRFVIVAHRDTSEYGPRLFGRDYAVETLDWLRESYDPVGLAGASPFEPTSYGMVLLRRREAATRPSEAPRPRAAD